MIRVDYIFVVEYEDVFRVNIVVDQQFYVGDSGSICVEVDYFCFFNFFVLQFKGIDYVGCCYDGCIVLVIVKNGYIVFFNKCVFNFKVFRCFDVFQIDFIKGICDMFNGFDKCLWVFRVYFDIENINIGKVFEQYVFVFYDWFICQWIQVIQIKNCGIIRDNSYQVVFGGVFVGVFWVFCDFMDWFGNFWIVCQ